MPFILAFNILTTFYRSKKLHLQLKILADYREIYRIVV